ncbi:MAG: fibronectin type III domain-containing protein [Bacteroidales bacterium]
MKHLLLSVFAVLFSINSFSQCTITTLPYQENFQSYSNGLIPPCWTSLGYYTGILGSSNRYLTITNATVVLPKIDTAIHINTLTMNFTQGHSVVIIVGVMDNNTDDSTFDTIAVFGSSSSFDFYNKAVNFSQYQGSGNYIAFKSVGSGSYVDDIIINTTPQCSKPFNLQGDVNSASVDLTWAEGNVGDSAWYIFYKVDTASVFDSIRVISKPYTINNLLPLTNYKFMVATDCGNSISLKSDTLSLRTDCNTIDTLPFIDSFNTSSSVREVIPICWHGSVTGTNNLYLFSNKLIFYYNNPAALTPAFNQLINLKDLTVSFDIKNTLQSSSIVNAMIVGVMDNNYDYSTLDTVFVLKFPYNSLKSVNLNFNQYQGNGRHIVFRASNYTIANLVIDYTPSCARPYNLTSNTNTTQTELSWTLGNSYDTAWYIYYKPSTSTVYDSVYANTSIFTLTNLLPLTNYTVFIRTACDSSLSESSDTIAFSTYCNTINNLPYIENFSTYGSGTTIFPPCWKQHNSDNGMQKIYVLNESLSLRSASNATRIAVTPRFSDSLSLNTLMLKFKMMAEDYSSDTTLRNLTIGAMTDIEDASTFDSITTVSANSNWRNIDINLSQFSFSGQYIAFKYSYDRGTMHIKNILIDEFPICPRPINPQVDNIENTSVDISWDLLRGDETMWKVFYKPNSNLTYDSIVATTNNITLNNLIPSSDYQAYIVTLCDSCNSQRSDTIYFRTNCATIDTLPFLETFTRSGINAFPTCWKTSFSELIWGSLTLSNEGFLISPEIDNSINISDLMIRFKSSISYGYQNNRNHIFTIGIITDPNDITTFDSITSVIFDNLWVEFDISLETYQGSGHYIAFKSNVSNSHIMIDDILIDYRASRCIRPDDLIAVRNSNDFLSVDLSWQSRDTNDVGFWVFSQVVGSNHYDSIYTTTNAVTIPNLALNTKYSFYIKTYCNIEGISLITSPINYITPCYNAPISSFPFTEDFSSGINCWILSRNGVLRETNWSLVNGSANYFGSFESVENSQLISPALNFITNMQVSFKLYKENIQNGYYKRVYVYINSTPDTVGAILIGTESANGYISGPYWDSICYLIPINNFGERYIIFRGEELGSFNIDDIVIEPSPTCPINYNPNLVKYNEHSITVDWNNSILVPQNWLLSYQAISPDSFDPSSSSATQLIISDTSLTSFTINGLNQGTTYSIALRPLCDTTWSNTVSVYTPQIAQIPYNCNFEDTIENKSWTISNGNAFNRWYISSAVDDDPIEGNSLLISNDNGITNNYSSGTVSCVSATRPFESTGADSYTLEFDLRMVGESNYDYLKVFVVDNDTTYNGSNTIQYYGNKNYSNQAVLFGGVNGTCPTCAYWNGNNYSVLNHTIQLGNQGVAGNIRKLIFVWVNDNMSMSNPPPVIDNISLIDNLIRVQIYDTICQGENYTQNGFNVDSAGVYTRTLQASNGNDSIITLNLMVNPTYHTNLTASICQGETYTENGFNADSTGIYTKNLQTIKGCDSIINLTLSVIEVAIPTNIAIEQEGNVFNISWQFQADSSILYRNNELISTLTTNTYQDTNLIDGVNYCYKLKAMIGDCVSEESQEECKAFLGINNINKENYSVNIYPNPARDYIIIEGENIEKIEIYNIHGQKLQEKEVNTSKHITLNTKSLTNGTYHIKIIHHNGQILTKKLIIAR